MALSPTLPAQRCRAALKARLSDATNGFNRYLRACVAGEGIESFTIDFSDDSRNFLQGKYSIDQIIEDESWDFPVLSVYQGPSRAVGREALMGTTYSGEMRLGLDVFLASGEGQSQSEFDVLVSCVHDAVINTCNDGDGQIDFARRALVWSQDIVMGQPSRVYDPQMFRYFSQLPFMLTLFSPE